MTLAMVLPVSALLAASVTGVLCGVAVVVPLGWQVIFQPQRWMTMMWWYRHYADLGIMPTLAKESLAWMRRVALRSA